jgi:cytochrome c oxidase assembly factor CtaG
MSVEDVTYALLGLSALLYLIGSRRSPQGSAGRRSARHAGLRAASFGAGLLVIVVAIAGPLDRLADQLLWAHMVQHLLLLLVAPPLLVLGSPWLPVWRGLPLGMRRAVARPALQARPLRPARSALRVLALPVGAFLAFNVDLWLWHVPAAYDATLRSPALHYTEHALFVATGLLFWAQVAPSWPFRRRLDVGGRLVYLLAASVSAWLLAVVLAFAPDAIYSAYASLPSRPGGISALADQRIAAGIMWVPGSIPFVLFVLVDLYTFLGREHPRSGAARPQATGA